jgi:hypothetical protein
MSRLVRCLRPSESGLRGGGLTSARSRRRCAAESKSHERDVRAFAAEALFVRSCERGFRFDAFDRRNGVFCIRLDPAVRPTLLPSQVGTDFRCRHGCYWPFLGEPWHTTLPFSRHDLTSCISRFALSALQFSLSASCLRSFWRDHLESGKVQGERLPEET